MFVKFAFISGNHENYGLMRIFNNSIKFLTNFGNKRRNKDKRHCTYSVLLDELRYMETYIDICFLKLIEAVQTPEQRQAKVKL